MCLNDNCPSHRNCYRFTAMPDYPVQAYSDFSPERGRNKCDHYEPNERAWPAKRNKSGGMKGAK
jgi:hypothetical protein